MGTLKTKASTDTFYIKALTPKTLQMEKVKLNSIFQHTQTEQAQISIRMCILVIQAFATCTCSKAP